jgi:hypothetical protein
MATKFLFLFIMVGLFSCNRLNRTDKNSKSEMILNLKNVTGSTIILHLTSNEDDLTINLPQDSILEIIGIKDSCYSIQKPVYEQIIKEKIKYLSYQKSDSSKIVLIDKNNGVFLTDIDIVTKSKGTLTVKAKDNKENVVRTIMNYPLE